MGMHIYMYNTCNMVWKYMWETVYSGLSTLCSTSVGKCHISAMCSSVTCMYIHGPWYNTHTIVGVQRQSPCQQTCTYMYTLCSHWYDGHQRPRVLFPNMGTYTHASLFSVALFSLQISRRACVYTGYPTGV